MKTKRVCKEAYEGPTEQNAEAATNALCQLRRDKRADKSALQAKSEAPSAESESKADGILAWINTAGKFLRAVGIPIYAVGFVGSFITSSAVPVVLLAVGGAPLLIGTAMMVIASRILGRKVHKELDKYGV